MNFKSVSDLSQDIKNKILPKLPNDIGTVYGIARSGVLPASIIATAIGASFGVAGEKATYGSRGAFINKNKDKILLVDDTIYRGAAMRRGLTLVGKPCYTCAIYASEATANSVNYFAEVLPGPRMFEWNFLGIDSTKNYMFDMDGVICTDPKVYDDDGVSYQKEIISGVRPFYLPQVEIGAICTNRIERWRPETEAWLSKHGVRVNKLIMQPFPTAVERRKHSDPALYKAAHYKDSDCPVFVESHKYQATVIAKASGKPVLCIETMELY